MAEENSKGNALAPGADAAARLGGDAGSSEAASSTSRASMHEDGPHAKRARAEWSTDAGSSSSVHDGAASRKSYMTKIEAAASASLPSGDSMATVPVEHDAQGPLTSAARTHMLPTWESGASSHASGGAGSGAAEAATGSAEAGARAGTGAGMRGALRAPASMVLFAQRKGAASWASVVAPGHASVARLKEQIQEKLQMTEPPDALTLHVAEVDDTGISLGAALDCTATVAEALSDRTGKIRLVISCSPAAATPVMPMPDDWLRDGVEGVSIFDPTVVTRERKCHAVFSDLAAQPVRLVQSPPGSGKTSLGILLRRYAKLAGPGHPVYLLDMNLWAASRKPLHEWWTAVTGTGMAAALDPTTGERRTFIIVEAQLLYTLGQDDPFWRAVKAVDAVTGEAPGTPSRVQVLLLAVYALRASAHQLGTPIGIPAAYTLSMLRLDSEEIAAFFDAYNSTCEAKGYPRISPQLQEAMQRVCNSHVGLLRACMRQLRNTFKGRDPISAEQEADFVATRLITLGSDHSLRALPALSDVKPADSEATEIRRIALAGESGVQLTETELDSFPRNLITAGVFDMETDGSTTRLTFSSPAMRTRALRYLFSSRPCYPLVESDLSTGTSFVRAVVKCMLQSELKGPASESTAASGPLLERQYQMSFYAAAISALPRGVFINPDYGMAFQPGGATRGYVDFYVAGMYNIGVELTRDGQALTSHAARSGSAGIYAPLKLKSWVVADFRQAVPLDSTLTSHPDVVFVVFSSDFGEAAIMQHGHAAERVALLKE